MITLTPTQSKQLNRFAQRIHKLRQSRLTVKAIYVPPYRSVVPGDMEITASTKENYHRLLRMLHRIVPDAKLTYEHGVGWHYLDRTPYYYGKFSFKREKD